MGLFGRKKEKAHCPICGAVMKYSDTMYALDGMICYDCAKKFDEIVPDKRMDTSIEQVKKVLEGGAVDESALGIPSICPACGCSIKEGERLFRLRDGYICTDCERVMRGDYSKKTVFLDPSNIEHRQKYRYEIEKMENVFSIMKNDTVVDDELADQSVAFIRDLVAIELDNQRSVTEEWNDQFDSLFQVDDSFEYDLGAFQGGIKNSELFQGKMVVKGALVKGSFSSEDEAVMIRDGNRTPVTVLDIILCDGWDFEHGMFLSSGDHTVTALSYAWMILDMELEEVDGDIIIAK